MLTPEVPRARPVGRRFTCFTGTKVPILTPEVPRARPVDLSAHAAHADAPQVLSVYLLYWHNRYWLSVLVVLARSTNDDTLGGSAPQAESERASVLVLLYQ